MAEKEEGSREGGRADGGRDGGGGGGRCWRRARSGPRWRRGGRRIRRSALWETSLSHTHAQRAPSWQMIVSSVMAPVTCEQGELLSL